MFLQRLHVVNATIIYIYGVQFLGVEDPLKKEMATHSNILAWRIPWTEESDGLVATGLQRLRHD